MTLIELFRLLPESLDVSVIQYVDKHKCENKTSCLVCGFMQNEGFDLSKEIIKIEPNFLKQIGIQSLNVYVEPKSN